MSIPGNSPISNFHHLRSSSAAVATVFYFPAARTGRVKAFRITNDAAATTADETFTLAYAPPGSTTFTNVANAAVVVPNATVAGTTTSVEPSPVSASCAIRAGGTFRVTPSGGSGGTVPITAEVTVGP